MEVKNMAKVIYDGTGSQVMAAREYDIAAATNIAEGSYVKLSAGKVINVVVGETTAILGVAAENHGGSADAFNLRANGLKIKVYDSPAAISEFVAPRATATSGSATTMAATGLATFVDNDFQGGYIKLVSKLATSTNTDPIGKVYPVTASTAATKLFTVASGQTHNTGDIYEIYPPVGFAKGNFDATFQKYDLTATAALPIKVANVDTAKGTIQVEAALHAHGNKQS